MDRKKAETDFILEKRTWKRGGKISLGCVHVCSTIHHTLFHFAKPLENLMEISFWNLLCFPSVPSLWRRLIPKGTGDGWNLPGKREKTGKRALDNIFLHDIWETCRSNCSNFFPPFLGSSRDPTFPYRPSISVLLPARSSINRSRPRRRKRRKGRKKIFHRIRKTPLQT